VKAEDKTKEQIIKELGQRIAELENSETLRKRAEESLKESLSMTSSMVEAFDGLVYICSKNYEVEFANKQLIERTGYNPTGQKCYKALHNLDEICPWCVNDRVFKGETVRWEVQSPKDNHWYYIVNTPIYHTDGSVSKMAMIQDISERKQIEEKLRRAYDELEIRVRNRTSELTKTNKILQDEITERKRIEEALRESEEKYRVLFEASPMGIGTSDLEGNILDCNQSMQKIMGFTLEELKSIDMDSIYVNPDERKPLLKALQETGRVRDWEVRLKRKDGTIYYALLYTDLLELRGHKVLLTTLRDITERKRIDEELRRAYDELEIRIQERTAELVRANEMLQAEITERKLSEAALQESEERYRKLVEFSPDAIGILSEGKIVFINAAGVKLHGAVNQEQIIGRPVIDFIHPEYQKLAKERIQLMIEKGKNVFPAEEKFLKLDGSFIDVDVRAMPFTYQGKPGIQVIIRDITDRKSAEEALKQSEEKYHKLIDNIQDGVFIIQDGKIQFANEAFAKVCGYTVEEVMGKDFAELVAPEDLELVADRYRRRQEGKDVPHEYEFHMMHRDGRTRILVNMNVGLITYRGRAASMGTTKDITEKKRLESQLLLAQRMESVGRLASGIAHDINNVLTPIMLSQELLQERLTDEESQRLLNTIERSTQRGANLMKQVQSFARDAKGERNVLQVAPVISEIREIAEETFPRSIKIRTDILKDLWTISGDATQLHQVIMNLCVNARDAMSNGGILSISAENLLIDEDYARINTEAKIGPYIIITVSDTGTGIPPEVMNRIFEPFYTTKEHGKGTGLGLSIALGIVKSHGGFITIYSEIGKGTAFKVYLPAITTPETLKAQEHQQELPAGDGESILVVDDEDQILEATKKTLGTHGYKVITANDGKEAIALYLQHREEIKLVLMDMMMPVMDGSASIRELHKVNPEIKIIAVSGLTETDKLAKADDVHVQAFLTKPYAADKLLSTIHNIISSK
jgi:PAS domain S-box-containing protein